ncbi:hypothetical protein ZIOFF_071268 [Zingiber officinale]|uniref:Uncharacterized protein n=1 Tax=Zingiber officinale TaxID=94328 RepID=A0A8J5EQD2_ZINOF|nr:hypothetical protein ZIOFF_071268 [Zingiber officinale]
MQLVHFFCRAIAPGVLDSDFLGFQTLRHVMRMTRTWDSTMSMIPKGGDTIWGGLEWSPEEGYECAPKKNKNNDSHQSKDVDKEMIEVPSRVNYGRIISFGKNVAETPSAKLKQTDFRVIKTLFLILMLFQVKNTSSC